MKVSTAKQICSLVIASLLALGVLVGAFLQLSWPPLALMAWLSLALFGKRTVLEAATLFVREMRGFGAGRP